MNSKQAFEEIIKACNFYHRQIANVDVDSIHGYPIKKIEKDLEILEMLKKKMTIETDYYDSDDGCEVYEYIAYNGSTLNIENEEEFNKIKEWLEE